MRQSAEAENLMTSVERVMEYGQLPSEAVLMTKQKVDQENFSHGKIVFDKVCLRYDADSGKKVLNEVTFATEASEKIGIVGRTGAGKSSLIVALFRLTEIESGKISIDDMDCAKMGLHELRKRISIIPQDPLLFSTTLRKNLDPFDQYQESDIWSALEQVILLIFLLGVNLKRTEQSIFKIIFVKLANFRENILEVQGDFLRSFDRSVGNVGKVLQRHSTTK